MALRGQRPNFPIWKALVNGSLLLAYDHMSVKYVFWILAANLM